MSLSVVAISRDDPDEHVGILTVRGFTGAVQINSRAAVISSTSSSSVIFSLFLEKVAQLAVILPSQTILHYDTNKAEYDALLYPVTSLIIILLPWKKEVPVITKSKARNVHTTIRTNANITPTY